MKKLLFLILLIPVFVHAQQSEPIDSTKYATRGEQPTIKNSAITVINPRIVIMRVALTSSPQTIDITTSGFTNVYAVVPQGENNTATVANMPNCSLKSFTNTSVIINTTVGNTGIVGLLAGLVVPTTFTGMYCDLILVGN